MTEFTLLDSFGKLGVASAKFWLTDQRSIGRTRSGLAKPTAHGDRIWVGEVNVRIHYNEDLRPILGLMAGLTEADGVFNIHPPECFGIKLEYGDVTAIDASDRRRIKVSGNNPQAGDYIGIRYDGGRKGLHIVHTPRDENGWITVSPYLSLNAVVGDALTFGRPQIRAIVDEDGYTPPTIEELMSEGLNFTWTQDLRRAQ